MAAKGKEVNLSGIVYLICFILVSTMISDWAGSKIQLAEAEKHARQVYQNKGWRSLQEMRASLPLQVGTRYASFAPYETMNENGTLYHRGVLIFLYLSKVEAARRSSQPPMLSEVILETRSKQFD